MRRFLSFVMMSGAAAQAVIAQGTGPSFLRPIKPDADTPTTLEWQSHPAGVYTIQYSPVLNGTWNTVEGGFPSQGATTRWTDRGNPTPDQFRFSSSDNSAQHRFYRLILERLTDTTMPITVTINNPAEGTALGGPVTISGSVSAAQSVSSIKLFVDGYCVDRSSGPGFSFQVDTKSFGNGAHRLSVVAEDAGAVESTEENNPLASREASYGVSNVNVTFSNLLSNAQLRYEHFRPELNQIQRILGKWSNPRSWQVDVKALDDSILYRSFTGQGSRIAIEWDGTDVTGAHLNSQIIKYVFIDLGPGTEPTPSPCTNCGGGPPSPTGTSASSPAEPSTPMAALLAGQDWYYAPFPPLPPIKKNDVFIPWEQVYGPLPPVKLVISETARRNLTGTATTSANVASSAEIIGSGEVSTLNQPYGILGTFAVLGQGHHPRFGFYPTPPRTISGRVRMSSAREFGPWGPLKRVEGLVNESAQQFTRMGYSVLYKKLDDQVLPGDLQRDEPGGNINSLNRANIGLFIGHSVAARDAEETYIWRQSYIPVYNSTFNSMEFVGSSEMEFGSDQLKWMAFFSCNMFRDSDYRTDGIYDDFRNFFALPMNANLHILHGYATEMSVHPDFAFWWTLALRKSPLVTAPNHSVIGAWNFACRRTQRTSPDAENVARSITWPECVSDFIYGYGAQTNPDRDPTDPLEQEALIEIDHGADSPD